MALHPMRAWPSGIAEKRSSAVLRELHQQAEAWRQAEASAMSQAEARERAETRAREAQQRADAARAQKRA